MSAKQKFNFWRRMGTFQLPDQPWRAGGEASVYKLGHEVAKIYHQLPGDETADRIRYLVSNQPSLVASGFVATAWAWPLDAIVDSDLDHVWGSVSPLVSDACPLGVLFDVRSREMAFPSLTCRHLPKIAANMMELIETTHQQGIIVGDISPGNLLVNAYGGISLVDIESAQISTPHGVFCCSVGTPDYLAPEVARLSDYSSVLRDWRQDSYGLGAVAYQLLTGGVHFCDGGAQVASGEWPPVDRAARINLGAWHASQIVNPKVRILPPDNVIDFDAFGPELGRLFIRCFDGGCENPLQRPSPREWRDALRRFTQELHPCPRNGRHYQHHSLTQCPWCEVAARTGVDPFPSNSKGGV